MRLINVKAFLEREGLIRRGKRVDRRAKVLEFGDDEVTEYAILSHRWTEQEVDYNEVVKLAKMDEEERSEIRQRDGYRKILQSCEQAKKDGYKWLWIDTCCIDKRSSAELHDVHDSSFPIAWDDETYPKSTGGWPEWFSRGWTLQEMIAPRDVQFFNKDWHSIGDKRSLSSTLEVITRVPQHILKEGLSSNRPCVAQIISWAANRRTTRVEDRAYSLMGLLDVNMPMLYGKGKKAFHRLQLEIIRASNDQSIFAWGCSPTNVRAGSILADDPSFFRDCAKMELMNRDEFIGSLKKRFPGEELPSIEDDRFGTFPVTNRGIQIWLFLCPHVDSDPVFQAWLPCRSHPSVPPVAIHLALWESTYYRYTAAGRGQMGRLQLRHVSLRYQDTPRRNSTFEIDDSVMLKEGFTSLVTCPERLITGNTVTVSTTDPVCVKLYSCRQEYHFVVSFGQCFGQNWIHVVCGGPDNPLSLCSSSYFQMLARAPKYAQSMNKACSGAAGYRVCIMETRIPQSTWILQTSCVMWNSSRMCGVRLEVFRDPGFGDVSGEWRGFDVDGTDDSNRDWRGLMIPHRPTEQRSCEPFLDGVSMKFSYAPNIIKLGDYGHFTDSGYFRCEGNLLADCKSLSLKANIAPREHKIFTRSRLHIDSAIMSGLVMAYDSGAFIPLYKPLCQSLPANDDFKSLLVSLSTRLTNRYLVTGVIQCPPRLPGFGTEQWYNIAKPFVWHRNSEGAFSVVGGAMRWNAG